MKRLWYVPALLLAVTLLLSGCSKTLHGTEDLLEKAREEIPISDAETIDLAYAGAWTQGESSLHWFVSGNAYQAHFYLPMECENAGEDAYRFVRVYKAMEPARDIACVRWQGGLCFLINRPECTTLRLTHGDGQVTEISLEGEKLPYVTFYSGTLSSYVFLNDQGEELS